MWRVVARRTKAAQRLFGPAGRWEQRNPPSSAGGVADLVRFLSRLAPGDTETAIVDNVSAQIQDA
jgi:hypothetical protein